MNKYIKIGLSKSFINKYWQLLDISYSAIKPLKNHPSDEDLCFVVCGIINDKEVSLSPIRLILILMPDGEVFIKEYVIENSILQYNTFAYLCRNFMIDFENLDTYYKSDKFKIIDISRYEK
jgi:hypothetical protein